MFGVKCGTKLWKKQKSGDEVSLQLLSLVSSNKHWEVVMLLQHSSERALWMLGRLMDLEGMLGKRSLLIVMLMQECCCQAPLSSSELLVLHVSPSQNFSTNGHISHHTDGKD